VFTTTKHALASLHTAVGLHHDDCHHNTRNNHAHTLCADAAVPAAATAAAAVALQQYRSAFAVVVNRCGFIIFSPSTPTTVISTAIVVAVIFVFYSNKKAT